MLVILVPAEASADDTIKLLGGRTLTGTIDSIDGDGRIHGTALPADLTFDGLRQIERGGPRAEDAKLVVELVGGGRVYANEVTLADEQCRIAWSLGEDLVLSIDGVRAIRFEPAAGLEQMTAALDKPSASFDRLLIKDGDRIQTIPGLIDRISAKDVVVTRNDSEVKVPRERLHGVVLASLGGVRLTGTTCDLELANQSRLSGVVKSLANNRLTVQLTRTTTVEIPWDHVRSVAVRSTRMTFLSDLQPTSVSEESIVAWKRPWRRDQNVTGGRLTLRLQDGDAPATRLVTFDKGIGTHARSRLTFELGRKYDKFLVTVGIDASTAGRGSCEVRILADDTTLFAKQITGGDNEPHELTLPVGGSNELTLVVEPGEELDLGDHVNWCDARLLRSAEQGDQE